MCKDLWPEIVASTDDSPKSILMQQAEYIGKKTEGRILGYVETTDGKYYETKKDMNNLIKRSENDLCHKLYIMVPEMNNVRFLIVSVLQNPFQSISRIRLVDQHGGNSTIFPTMTML